MTQRNWLMNFIYMKKMIRPKMKVKQKSLEKTRYKRPKTVVMAIILRNKRHLGLIFK